MNKTIFYRDKLSITHNTLANIACITYFSMPFIRMVIGYLIHSSLAFPLSFFITYSLVLILVFASKKRFKSLLRFISLVVLLVVLLTVSVTIHPNYEYWFTRETYGVLPYIFRPDNGIYAFLFVLLVDNPEELLKDLKISGCLMYIYFLRQLLQALSVGYWMEENAAGQYVQFSYSLDFGYSVLPFALVFVYFAIKNRKMFDICAAGIGILMMLIGGSRGAVLCLAIFLIIYMMVGFQNSRKKFIYIFLLISTTVILYMFYEPLLYAIANIFDKFNLPSRFIYKLLEGSIANGQGRDAIWEAGINMIKEKPLLGHGAMGARYVISQYHNVGYPHNIIMELMIEYGVLIGGGLSIVFFFTSIKNIFDKSLGEWRYLYIISFANFCELFLSYTYWHKQALWICLGLLYCMRRYKKMIKRM